MADRRTHGNSILASCNSASSRAIIALIKSLRIACGRSNGPVVAKIRLQISATSVICSRTVSATNRGISVHDVPPLVHTVSTNSFERVLEDRGGCSRICDTNETLCI
jgi:hypothetical protein